MSSTFENSKYKEYHTIFLFFCLLSLNIMPSSFIHVIANGKTFFLLMTKYYSIVCMDIFFSHSPNDIHLDCFHVLAIVNNGTMNMVLLIYFWDPIFPLIDYIPRSRTTQLLIRDITCKNITSGGIEPPINIIYFTNYHMVYVNVD